MRIAAITVILVVVFGVTSIVGAVQTPIADSPDANNEPNLLGVNPYPDNLNPSVLESLYGESNLRRVDDALDRAFRHTGDHAIVKAVARFNHPSIEEQFAYFDPSAGNWQTVLRFQRVPPNFLYPVGYVLPTVLDGVIPRSESGPVFEVRARSQITSNPSHNPSGQDMLVTFEIVGVAGHPNNQIGNYVLAWEVFPNTDMDYQDVVFELSGAVPVPVPEPTSCALIACGLLAAALFPRCPRR